MVLGQNASAERILWSLLDHDHDDHVVASRAQLSLQQSTTTCALSARMASSSLFAPLSQAFLAQPEAYALAMSRFKLDSRWIYSRVRGRHPVASSSLSSTCRQVPSCVPRMPSSDIWRSGETPVRLSA
eukprot:s2907_g3.t1